MLSNIMTAVFIMCFCKKLIIKFKQATFLSFTLYYICQVRWVSILQGLRGSSDWIIKKKQQNKLFF